METPPLTPLGARTPHAHPAYAAIIATLVCIIAIGGYFALASSQSWWPYTQESAVPGSDQHTSTWKTERLYSGGEEMEVSIPPTWDIGVGYGFMSIYNTASSGESILLTTYLEPYDTVVAEEVGDKRDTVFAGRKSTQVFCNADDSDCTEKVIVPLKSGAFGIILFPKRNPLGDQILSTFKFTK